MKKPNHCGVNIVSQNTEIITRKKEGNSTVFTYTPLYIKKSEDEYSDLAVPFELEENASYHLVYVTHSDGDCYNSIAGCAAIVDLFKSPKIAEQCAKAILDHYKIIYDNTWRAEPIPKNFDDTKVAYLDDLDNKKTVAVKWNSNFAYLSEVNVEKIEAVLICNKKYTF